MVEEWPSRGQALRGAPGTLALERESEPEFSAQLLRHILTQHSLPNSLLKMCLIL